MTNTNDLFEYRMGIEATDGWGTAVAQSLKLMDVENIDITPIVMGTQVKDRRGTFAPGYNSILNEIRGEASLTGWLNVEQCPYWFNSLLQDVDPTTDAAGNTWNWVAPTSDGEPAINSFTLTKGIAADVNTVKSLLGATVNSMTISGAVNEPLGLSVGFVGKQVSTDTFDSDAEADLTTQILTSCHVALYVDPDTDAIGTTAITTTGFDFSLDINANRSTYGHLGSCVHDSYRGNRFEGALTLGLEFDSTSAAYIDAILTANTSGLLKKAVRVLASVDTDNYVQLDFNGVALESPSIFTDRDGVTTLNLTLNGQYGAALGNWLKVEARNATEAF